ncbi:MAG: hypothetical protein KKA73_18530 [Chloroflexi bacterium]|nr:hypothetical protein [Chloroflexota bacterium]MBU1749685.1 hypothetical protein [Chloroflexota bacterium]
MNETVILLRAGADIEVDNPPGFAVLRLTPESARRYLDLLARATDLAREIPGFLRFAVSDFALDWWTWTEPLDEIMYEPNEGSPRWPDELEYRVVDAADLQARLADADDPAQRVSDDLVQALVDENGVFWKGVLRHSDVVIWTKALPAAVLRELADEPSWTWAPPAGEETDFAFVPPGGVFLFRRLRPAGAGSYDPEYWVKVEEPGADARCLADPATRIAVAGDAPVWHVTAPIRVFAAHTIERWTVDVEYTVAAQDEAEARQLITHGRVDYDRHEHPGHDDQVLTIAGIEEM